MNLLLHIEKGASVFFYKKIWLNSSLCNDKKEIQCTYIHTKKGIFIVCCPKQNRPKKKMSEVTIFRQWVLGGDAKTKIQKFCYYFLVRTLAKNFGSFIGSLCMIIISSSLPPSTWQNWNKSQKKQYPLWKRERSKG